MMCLTYEKMDTAAGEDGTLAQVLTDHSDLLLLGKLANHRNHNAVLWIEKYRG